MKQETKDADQEYFKRESSFVKQHCYEFDCDYSGNDIAGGFKTKDARSYQKRCQKNAKCTFWTRHATGSCHLKNSKAGRKARKGAISGVGGSCEEPKLWRDDGACGPTDPTGFLCNGRLPNCLCSVIFSHIPDSCCHTLLRHEWRSFQIKACLSYNSFIKS